MFFFRFFYIIFMLLFVQVSFAQVKLGQAEIRAFYKVSAVFDSLRPTQMDLDTMLLDFSQKHSVFYDPIRRQGDSTMQAQMLKAMRSGSNFQMNRRAFGVDKNSTVIVHQYPQRGKLTFFTENLGNDLTYEEDYPLMQWQLSEETKTLAGYTCRKASTRFRGRTWEVWYTLEVPTNFGVWKFYGLPGLIVLAKDSRGHFAFELIGLKRLPPNTEMNSHYFGESPKSFTKITHKKYIAEVKKYAEDPVGYKLALLANTPVEIKAKDNKGNQNKIKAPYNPIEFE